MKDTLIERSEFIARRQRFIAQMAPNSIAIFAANQEVIRSHDTEYPFCQDKHFYYLTGFNEPDAVLVMLSDEQKESILFCREKDPQAEVWHGRRVGEQLATAEYGVEQAYPLSEFSEKLVALLSDKSQLWYCQGRQQSLDKQITSALAQVKSLSRQGITAPSTIVDCAAVVDEMRLIKSDAELAIMRKVNQISANAHQRAMEKCRAELFEYQIEAELLHEFARNGARYAAYGSIVASGDNANILHYTNNDQTLTDGDLLLIDAGGELAGYAADITRTFPINGTFSQAQKQLYQLVLSAQQQCIAAIKPGQTLAALNDIANQVLTQGLLELGILMGELDELIASKACKKYFIHGLGHWLGLDVHDVGDYQVTNKRQLRAFEPGMVLTIEPGLYIPLEDKEVEQKWRGIGIRIEDNILVTDLGHENLSENAPKSVADIERIMTMAKSS